MVNCKKQRKEMARDGSKVVSSVPSSTKAFAHEHQNAHRKRDRENRSDEIQQNHTNVHRDYTICAHDELDGRVCVFEYVGFMRHILCQMLSNLYA